MKVVIVYWMNLWWELIALAFVTLEVAEEAFFGHCQLSMWEEMAGAAGHNRFSFVQVSGN